MFGGGGGGLNPRKMKQMMQQMGIDMDDIDAEEVIIRTADEELYFDDAEVQLMEAQGQKTYQVVGEPDRRDRDESGTAADTAAEATGDSAGSDAVEESQTGGGDVGIPDDDVELVAMRADVDEATARDALEATDGDLAAAVERLE